jgi:hypothetical protein
LWDHPGQANIYVMDDPFNLTSESEVDWLLKEYGEERPGLIVFDVIYGMGLKEENNLKEAMPIINNMKRISQEWNAATLALGHPGHNGERRFRGWSGWRQLAAVEWHMADGSLTCEKSKIADARKLSRNYEAMYPHLKWLDTSETLGKEAQRMSLIKADIRDYPDDSDNQRAKRLQEVLGLGNRRARDLIKDAKMSIQAEAIKIDEVDGT